ncbi:hypothetical protein EDC04DRAFT_563079 [Pisolithus marmoratus]|nr:hypothetical protein EDC04DRAFT_563079 [Pisolithus marmoratus]
MKANHEVDHDSYDIGPELRQIMALQEQLDTVNNEDEQRALEEDVTGKILWAFWVGVHQEVKGIPAKIVDRTIGGTLREQRKMRVQALHEISEIFQKALSKPANDAQAHLRRIMADAGAGISKYELLCSARATLNVEGHSTTTVPLEVGPASAAGKISGMVNSRTADRSLEIK